MLEYILIILIPFIFSFVTIKGKSKKHALYIGKSEYIRKNSLALPLFFLFYFVLLACRNVTVGNDTANYEYYFEVYNFNNYSLNIAESDFLFVLFCWLFSFISNNFQLFLATVAAFCVWPIAKLYCENRKNSMLQIAVFVNLSTFIMLFSGIRQAMAMAIGVAAYYFVRNKKPLWFIITCIIAFGFHHSAFILFLMYPLYHISFKKKDLWYIVPSIAVSFLFNKQIFSFIAGLAAMISDKYEDVVITQTGAVTTFLMFISFAVFCYMVPDETKMDKEMLGLRNFLMFAMIIQSFASLNNLAMRMNYYYMIFIPIILAKVVDIPKDRYRQVAKAGSVAITVFLIAYFIYTTYTGYKTGESALNTVPYVAFWENSL